MIIFRLLLYLICAISIGWSILVFGGPPIIKRLILGYSDGALIPSGITVSPGLAVGISRLEFSFQNEVDGWSIEGFSRASKLAWSLFGDKPFLEINLGPSVLKDYASADSVKLYTPSFKKIDWENISVVANIDGLSPNSFAKIQSLSLDGNLNTELAKLLNVNIRAEEFGATDGKSSYTARSIKGNFRELSYNANLAEQLLSGTFTIEDIIISEPSLTVPKAIMSISMTENARNIKMDLHDLRLPEFDGYMQKLEVDGSFTDSNVLQELQIVFDDGAFSNNLPKFHEISASVKKSGHEYYQAKIEGSLVEFELSGKNNFIGLLPAGNFAMDLEIDRAATTLTSVSKINFTTFSSIEIFGFVEMGFSSELLRDLECAFWDCELTDLNLNYKMNFNDEWIRGRAECPNSLCSIAEINHVVRTSNTINVFTILNQANILNPLSSLYLFGAISSGQKINEGHELKFQF